MNGTVRKLKNGYGFIAGQDGIDYFFHWQMLSKFTIQFRYLKENQDVTFEPEYTDRGPRARDIKVTGHTIDVEGMRERFSELSSNPNPNITVGFTAPVLDNIPTSVGKEQES